MENLTRDFASSNSMLFVFHCRLSSNTGNKTTFHNFYKCFDTAVEFEICLNTLSSYFERFTELIYVKFILNGW